LPEKLTLREILLLVWLTVGEFWLGRMATTEVEVAQLPYY
jgi:hypothetical protein